MFMGHYGVSFAAKPVEKRLPLWLLFIAVQWLVIAVQWLDIGWSVNVAICCVGRRSSWHGNS